MVTKINEEDSNGFFSEILDSLSNQSKEATSAPSVSRRDTDFTYANTVARANGVVRSAWVMSTTEWLSEQPPRGLAWAVNPRDVTWSMPQRSVHSKNLIGTVLHVWPDNFRNTFFDELKVTFNLQAGNILPVFLGTLQRFGQATQDAIRTGRVPGGGFDFGAAGSTFLSSLKNNLVPAPGLANFYDFMKIVDAPKLTAGNGPADPPRPNIVSVQYVSNLFPSLTLFGMFDSAGIRFVDSSNDPNTVSSWAADFIVYDTAPKLSDNLGDAPKNVELLDKWLEMRVGKGNIRF